MADSVTTQLLQNGPQRAVFVFTNFSDGTGESGVKKVDATSSGPLGVTIAGHTYYPGTNLVIANLTYDIKGGTLQMLWDATSAQQMLVLGNWGRWRLRDSRGGFGGITCRDSTGAIPTGATGSILFTFSHASAGSGYTVILELWKGIPQS